MSVTVTDHPSPTHTSFLSLLQVITTKGEEMLVDSPAKLPPASDRQCIMEPYVKVEMLAPTTYTVRERARGRR